MERRTGDTLGAWLFIVFGLLTSSGAHPLTAAGAILFADLIIWPLDGGVQLTTEVRWLCAILGGVMIGWGVIVLKLIATVPDRAVVRSIVLAGVGTWFVVDSAGSLAAGVPLNVLSNLVFLLAFLVPWLPRRSKS